MNYGISHVVDNTREINMSPLRYKFASFVQQFVFSMFQIAKFFDQTQSTVIITFMNGGFFFHSILFYYGKFASFFFYMPFISGMQGTAGKSKDRFISDILLWTPTNRGVSFGRAEKTYYVPTPDAV